MENVGLKGLGVTLWQRIVLSYKSTLLGLAVASLGVVIDNLNNSPNHIVKLIGIALGAVFVLVKEQLPKPPAVVPSALVAFALLCGLAAARPALAQATPPLTPSQLLGGCNASGKVCWGPELALTLTSISTRTGHIDASFNPGLGYGLTFWRGTAHELGFGGYAMFQTGEDQRALVSIIGSFNNYLRFGFARAPVGREQDNYLVLGFGTSL